MRRRGKRSRNGEPGLGIPGNADAVSAVFENLEDYLTIDELVHLYDGLTREQVFAVLDFGARSTGPALARAGS